MEYCKQCNHPLDESDLDSRSGASTQHAHGRVSVEDKIAKLEGQLDELLMMRRYNARNLDIIRARMEAERQREVLTVEAMKAALAFYADMKAKIDELPDDTGEIQDHFDYLKFQTIQQITDFVVTKDKSELKALAMVLMHCVTEEVDAEGFEKYLGSYQGLRVLTAFVLAEEREHYEDESRYKQ